MDRLEYEYGCGYEYEYEYGYVLCYVDVYVWRMIDVFM